jgi:hypothetical protein
VGEGKKETHSAPVTFPPSGEARRASSGATRIIPSAHSTKGGKTEGHGRHDRSGHCTAVGRPTAARRQDEGNRKNASKKGRKGGEDEDDVEEGR